MVCDNKTWSSENGETEGYFLPLASYWWWENNESHIMAAMFALFCFCLPESLFVLSPVMKCLSISDFCYFWGPLPLFFIYRNNDNCVFAFYWSILKYSWCTIIASGVHMVIFIDYTTFKVITNNAYVPCYIQYILVVYLLYM